MPTGITIQVVAMDENELKFMVYGLTGTPPPGVVPTVPDVQPGSSDNGSSSSSALASFSMQPESSQMVTGFAVLAMVPLLRWL